MQRRDWSDSFAYVTKHHQCVCSSCIVVIILDWGHGGFWSSSEWVPIFQEAWSTAQGLPEPSSIQGSTLGTRAAEHQGCNWACTLIGICHRNIKIRILSITFHYITIYYENILLFHAKLGLDVNLYQVPPHIPEYCPFRLQTEHFHVILHTLSPSLPARPAHIFHSDHLYKYISARRHPIIPILTFQYSHGYHLNLPNVD